MATQTFELVSPFLTIYAPSKKWDTSKSDLLLGQTATRLVTGELLSYFGANSVTRPDSGLAAATLDAQTSWCAPYFSETGRGDIVTGGNVPVLQFGPFEADTMLFMRKDDDHGSITQAGAGQGNLANGPHAGFAIGEKVFACAVRNPLNGSTFDANNYVIGIAPAAGINNADAAICVGRVSRIIGSGAKAKIRVMFGVN
jgi:hypothetical protein